MAYVEVWKSDKLIARRFAGFTDKGQTEMLGRQIERLVTCIILGEQPSLELSRWLEGILKKLIERFVRIGLIDNKRAEAGKVLTEHLNQIR